MSKKQTAVEYLLEQFSKYYAIHQLEDEIDQARQMMREQIEEAYLASQKKCVDTIEKYAGISLPKSKAAISEIEQGGKNEDASDYFEQNYGE